MNRFSTFSMPLSKFECDCKLCQKIDTANVQNKLKQTSTQPFKLSEGDQVKFFENGNPYLLKYDEHLKKEKKSFMPPPPPEPEHSGDRSKLSSNASPPGTPTEKTVINKSQAFQCLLKYISKHSTSESTNTESPQNHSEDLVRMKKKCHQDVRVDLGIARIG